MKGGGYVDKYIRDLPSSKDDCGSIDFHVNLQNLQATLANYKKHEILDVKLNDEGLVIVTGNFGILGYIPAMESLLLIECLKKGRKYRANIIAVSETTCSVRVLPK